MSRARLLAAAGLLALGLLAALLAVAPGGAQATDTTTARDLVRTGRYEEALGLLGSDPGDEAAVRVLASARLALGRYAEAEQLLREQLARYPELATTLGEVLARRGERSEAATLFRRAEDERHADALSARLARAQLLLESGDLDAAEAGLYGLIDAYNQRERLSAQDLTAVGLACQLLGRDNPDLFKDALKAFDEAIAADPSEPRPRVLLGELFLEKYDSTEARTALRDVLATNSRHPQGLLAMARVLHFDGSSEALELVEQSLAIDPSLVEARVFLAQLRLELEEFETAEQEARRALEVNPAALEALTALAASQLLRDQTSAFEQTRAQVLALNPRYAEFYNQLAEISVRIARYPQARDFAVQAVALDPKSWRGYQQLGMNQLRLGEIEAGRASLVRSFTGDPYNVWVKNTLDLMDTYAHYDTRRTERFELFLHQKESRLLAPYLGTLAEEAYQALAERYRFKPPVPIRIEVYPSHEDFSVRTVGLTGLGALGVCFGPVVAVDSPSAREPGQGNWGSTLWHELAHTFTLELTRGRIPRWLTEGISVHEERRARAGWGDDVRPEFLEALNEDQLLGLAELNNGFVRPTFPLQIVLSYYQASLVVEQIEREWGFEQLLAILRGYRDGGSTEAVFREVLGVELEEFDRRFFARLRERFAGPLQALAAGQSAAGEPAADADADPHAAPSLEQMRAALEQRAQNHSGDYRAQLGWGSLLYADERAEEALPFLERARDLFPQFASETSAYALLAKIRTARGENDQAIRELRALTDIDETSHASHRELARLLRAAGDEAGAARILERDLYIYPLEASLHEELAELYEHLRDRAGVVRERQAIVDLDPPDRARALYRLAQAQHQAGDPKAARRSVLRALELAPGYDEAQELLLELTGRASS